MSDPQHGGTPAALIEGFRRFRDHYFDAHPELYQRLAREGQSPRVLVVSCCDSRTPPDVITDSAPGELFVVRNVANLVPPYEEAGTYHGTSAALEFGVRVLRVKHVIVLGHAQCGGIRTLLAGQPDEDGSFVSRWMSIARAAREQVLASGESGTEAGHQRACEQAALRVSLVNLMTFPWVREPVDAGELALHAWYFDLDEGALYRLDAEVDQFVRV